MTSGLLGLNLKERGARTPVIQKLETMDARSRA